MSFLGSLVGSTINTVGNIITNKQNIDNSWDMWNATNQYNSPTNQVRRLQDAGINPATIFGSGASAGIASTGNVAQARNPFDANYIQQALETASISEDIRNKELQGDLLRAQASKIKADTKAVNTSTAYQQEYNRRYQTLPEGSVNQRNIYETLLMDAVNPTRASVKNLPANIGVIKDWVVDKIKGRR